MSPSAETDSSTLSDEHTPDPRPLKRPRKTAAGRSREPEEHCFPTSAPLDHIFIAEGLVNKKAQKKQPLSCAECRRLKLKCDRSFPCASCKKRGCAEICPEGVLVSGKGTRFILANTEQLHAKIIEMSDRIRHLEEALESLQSTCSDDPHPLLRADLLTIKSALGLYGGTQTGAGTIPSPPPEKDSQDHEHVKLSMDIDSHDHATPEECHEMLCHELIPKRDPRDDQLPPEIIRLSRNFPVPESITPEPNPAMRDFIRSMLPPQSHAEYLWAQARDNALWQYNPHPNETFMPNLLHHVYSSPLEDLCPRRLALLLMILAVGCLVNLNEAPDSPDAERYHHLARASLTEIPVMEDTTVDTISALFYMTWYLLVFSDKKKAAGHAWGLMGLTAKLAQSIGLHRDGVKSKGIPEEVEKRRALFWELMYLDARLSLSLGRPPSLFLKHMDCKRPSYLPDVRNDPSESLHYYQEWKHSCYIHCLSPVLEIISSPVIDYTTVIDLDRKIRDFSTPRPLQSGVTQSRPLIMQKASLSTALEAVLLQLHRTFFTRALSGPEEAFNRRHKYAPSVVAVFLSASRMIATVEALYRREPNLTARILWYWSNAFSAAVALCILVSRAPFTCLSPAALQELERARLLFNEAKETCPRALQVIPILETMVEKANHIYLRWAEGQDVPSLVLRHTDDTTDSDGRDTPGTRTAKEYAQTFMTPQPTTDSFANAHPSLSQCISEVHQRALKLFPTRKPCQCSARAAQSCPPSHSWSPSLQVAPLQTPSPVLPDLYSGNFTYGIVPVDGPPGQSSSMLGPESRMAVVDTLNFDFGAMNPSWNDQSWMAWF